MGNTRGIPFQYIPHTRIKSHSRPRGFRFHHPTLAATLEQWRDDFRREGSEVKTIALLVFIWCHVCELVQPPEKQF